MEERVEKQLEDKHTWLYDQFADFFFRGFCKVEVDRMLFELEQDDHPNTHPHDLLDQIVDVECEQMEYTNA